MNNGERILIGAGCLLIFIFIFGSIQEFRDSRECKKYRLANGDIVECNREYKGGGMINLVSCRDGNKYLSQTNVVRIK
jgi:hypothetical protein